MTIRTAVQLIWFIVGSVFHLAAMVWGGFLGLKYSLLATDYIDAGNWVHWKLIEYCGDGLRLHGSYALIDQAAGIFASLAGTALVIFGGLSGFAGAGVLCGKLLNPITEWLNRESRDQAQI